MSSHNRRSPRWHTNSVGRRAKVKRRNHMVFRKRYCCQFTVSYLLAAMTLSSLFFSWLSVTQTRYEREWQAARELEDTLHLVAVRDANYDGIIRTLLSRISGHDYRPIIELEPRGTRAWADCHSLTPSRMKDVFAPIRHLQHLRRVTLAGAYVTDDSLEHLGDLPQLEYVSLCGEHIRGKAFRHWGKLTQLRRVDLAFTSVDNTALTYLQNVESLEVLIVEGRETQIDDDGLKSLHKYANLKALGLCDSRITDKGLLHLTKIKSLQELCLSQNRRITQRGIHILQAEMPNLIITCLDHFPK